MSAGLLTVSTTIINESEFPSLGRGTPASFSLLPTTSGYGSTQSPGPPGYATNNRPNYANLMRSGTEGLVGGNEFHIHSEDFPALPGATAAAKAHSGSVGTSGALNSPSSTTPDPTLDGHTSMAPPFQLQIQQAVIDSTNGAVDGRFGFLREEGQSKHGIQTHPDGEVTNIPPGMLNDQYGMAGLITYLRAVDNPAIVALALGHDLTTLGLNLNAPEHPLSRMLYTSFGGPWADSPMRPLDMDVKVPSDYLTNSTIRDKLPSIRMNKLNEDSLFYLFYNCPGEVYQVAAAAELYTREWRYHKTEMLWLTRSQYGVVKEQTAAYERGSFNVFDPVQWRKRLILQIPRDMTLEYKELEERPKLPAALNMIGGPLPAILMPANATAPTSTSTSASASSTSTITASAATPTTSAMPTSTVANVNAIAAVSPAATTPTSAAVSSAPSPAAPTPLAGSTTSSTRQTPLP